MRTSLTILLILLLIIRLRRRPGLSAARLPGAGQTFGAKVRVSPPNRPKFPSGT